MKKSFDEIVEKLKNCKSVAISGHIDTDGDCLGSMTALYNFLLSNGKKADMFLDSIVPDNFKILPGLENLNSKEFLAKKYDLFVSVDCSTPKRLGKFAEDFLKFKNSVLIDHHIKFQGEYAKTSYIEEDASSCGEVLYKILKNVGSIDKDCATCLYSAILSDTNSFSNPNVSASTFRTVADVVELGADIEKITYFTQKVKTKTQERLISYMTRKVKIFDDVAILVMSKRKMKSLGVKSSEVSKFLQIINHIEGVKITILAKENAYKQFKITIRTLPKYNAVNIASLYGGGGHKNAAGCVFNGCKCKLTKEIVLASKNEIKRADNEWFKKWNYHFK